MLERSSRPPLLALLALGAALGLSTTAGTRAQALKGGGWLLDPQGQPVAGAQVRLHPLPSPLAQDRTLLEGESPVGLAQISTGESGRFELEAPEAGMWLLTVTAPGRVTLSAPGSGRYRLLVTADGYAPWSRDDLSSSTLRVVMRRGGPRSLVVRSPQGQGLPGAFAPAARKRAPRPH